MKLHQDGQMNWIKCTLLKCHLLVVITSSYKLYLKGKSQSCHSEESLVGRFETKNWGSGLEQELKNISEQLQETTANWLYQTNIVWEIFVPLSSQQELTPACSQGRGAGERCIFGRIK